MAARIPLKNKGKKDASFRAAISLWVLLLGLALLTLLSLLPLRADVAEVILMFTVLLTGMGLAGAWLIYWAVERGAAGNGETV
ncbi:MAG: hypothetical protein AB1439_12745 [candidate division FCPU426 bacterium]